MTTGTPIPYTSRSLYVSVHTQTQQISPNRTMVNFCLSFCVQSHLSTRLKVMTLHLGGDGCVFPASKILEKGRLQLLSSQVLRPGCIHCCWIETE